MELGHNIKGDKIQKDEYGTFSHAKPRLGLKTEEWFSGRALTYHEFDPQHVGRAWYTKGLFKERLSKGGREIGSRFYAALECHAELFCIANMY